MTLSNSDKKQLRGIGHRLKPVVTIAARGLTDNVLEEIDRALRDHELIKIRLAVGDRQKKTAAVERICRELGAETVQQIGHVLLLYRKAVKRNLRLSNLIRHTSG